MSAEEKKRMSSRIETLKELDWSCLFDVAVVELLGCSLLRDLQRIIGTPWSCRATVENVHSRTRMAASQFKLALVHIFRTVDRITRRPLTSSVLPALDERDVLHAWHLLPGIA